MAAPRSPQRQQKPGEVRIIAGQWRGRRLPVADRPGLRPTSDRIRETLFNWLSPRIAGARCLDLFAGTGVLGLEALSRGAGSALLVENDPIAAKALRESASRLNADNATVVEGDAYRWLTTFDEQPFDIVFLDPPFSSTDWDALLPPIGAKCLTADAEVYLEAEKIPILRLAEFGYRVKREKSTKHVETVLLESTTHVKPEA